MKFEFNMLIFPAFQITTSRLFKVIVSFIESFIKSFIVSFKSSLTRPFFRVWSQGIMIYEDRETTAKGGPISPGSGLCQNICILLYKSTFSKKKTPRKPLKIRHFRGVVIIFVNYFLVYDSILLFVPNC